MTNVIRVVMNQAFSICKMLFEAEYENVCTYYMLSDGECVL